MKRDLARLLLVATIILLGYGLLTWDLDAYSVWIDEHATLEVVSQPALADFFDAVVTREGRPPLYYLLLRGWIAMAGHSDFSVRYLSVLFSVTGIALTFALGRALLGHVGGAIAALLTATAPYYILYGRMIRAYPLTVLVGLASCLFFALLLRQDRLTRWIGYVLGSIALMYTDYFVMALLAAQNLIWLAVSGWRRLSWKKWGLIQGLLVVVFAPWVPSVIGQSTKYSGEADFAYGLSGYAAKILYPLYSFAIGETIFPWHPAALIGVPLILGLAFWGYVVLYRRDRLAFFFTALAFVIPLLYTVFFVSTWWVPVLPFITFGSRMMFAGPLLYLPIAAGLIAFGTPADLHRYRRPWRSISPLLRMDSRHHPHWLTLGIPSIIRGRGRVLCLPNWATTRARPYILRRLILGLSVIVLTRAFALRNYYIGCDFHNAIYTVPTREIAATVTARAQPNDMVVANVNIPLEYYYAGSAPVFRMGRKNKIQTYIEQSPPAHIWVVHFERDRSTAANPLDAFVASIQDEYILIENKNYVPQDPLYARVKAGLLNHAGYEYKARLFLYVRADE